MRNRARLEKQSGLNPTVVEFFELPHGLEFLDRLLCAFHFVFDQANDGGIQNICWLLKFGIRLLPKLSSHSPSP